MDALPWMAKAVEINRRLRRRLARAPEPGAGRPVRRPASRLGVPRPPEPPGASQGERGRGERAGGSRAVAVLVATRVTSLPRHSGASLAQCASFSARLQQSTKCAAASGVSAASVALADSISGCTMAPDPSRAKRLNGWVPVVRRPSSPTSPRAASSPRRRSTPWARSSARSVAYPAAVRTFGRRVSATSLKGSVASATAVAGRVASCATCARLRIVASRMLVMAA